MIWGYHYFWKHPYIILKPLQSQLQPLTLFKKPWDHESHAAIQDFCKIRKIQVFNTCQSGMSKGSWCSLYPPFLLPHLQKLWHHQKKKTFLNSTRNSELYLHFCCTYEVARTYLLHTFCAGIRASQPLLGPSHKP